MASSLSKLKIGHKLALSACAFAFPIVFILWTLAAEQNVVIRFASKEVRGAYYLSGIARLQGELDLAVLDKAAVPAEAVGTLTSLDASMHGQLHIGPQLGKAISALRAASVPASVPSARDTLHDLIARIGDRSNLTLDNVLATNHLADVVFNGLPDAIDRITDLTQAQSSDAEDASAQARFMVGLGALESDLDSMSDSLAAAEQADSHGQIKTALDDEYQTLQTGLKGFIKDLKARKASTQAARDQVAQVAHFSQDVAQELAVVLKTRVAALHRAELRMFGVTLLLFAAAFLGMLWALRRGVTRPLNGMTETMRKLAAGDLAVEVPCIGNGDEIGAMADAVQVFKDNALRNQALEHAQVEASCAAEDERLRHDAEQAAAAEAARLVVGSIGAGLERLAAGDLTYRLDTALPPAYEALRTNLNKTITQLRAVVQGIVASTEGLRSGTSEIAHAADDLSRRTEQQAASLEETAAALEQITTTVRKAADGARSARDAVSRAKADAERSGVVVSEAVTAMSRIETSAQQISNIIGVIDEIAFQTNLLALNAGVEAARAGDAGRGFAVVASEVRALAQRSANAAKEIKALISTSTQQVGEGVRLVGETGQALTRIVDQVTEIAGAVSEIAASAQEQATGLAEVSTAINQMDQVTQQNAAMVEESTAASLSLAQETEELAKLTQCFRTDGDSTREPAGNAASLPPARAARTRITTKEAEPKAGSHYSTALKPFRTTIANVEKGHWEEF